MKTSPLNKNADAAINASAGQTVRPHRNNNVPYRGAAFKIEYNGQDKMKTYFVVQAVGRNKKFTDYREALHAAIDACKVDYPVFIVDGVTILHHFIIDCFGRLTDTYKG
jgi:hypothetical protein